MDGAGRGVCPCHFGGMIPEGIPPTSGERGRGGDVFGAKTPPPATPSGNVGGFRISPHTPLKRPDQGACGPPILDYTPGGGAERETIPFVDHPESKAAVRHAAAGYLCFACVGRTRHWPASLHRTGHGDQTFCAKRRLWRRLCAKAPFFSTAAAATFLSARRKKSGGRIPRPAKPGTFPTAPQRGAIFLHGFSLQFVSNLVNYTLRI